MEYPTLAQGARLTAVKLKDTSGADIGKVVEWFMDIHEGKVVFVVAHFEGHDDYYPIPWALMKPDPGQAGYRVDPELVFNAYEPIPRTSLSTLLEDQRTIANVLDRQPGGNQRNESHQDQRSRDVPDTHGPSNAELSEGKGYGG
jgi:hypothetical protein